MKKLLLNRKTLLIIASILALVFTLAFVISHFDGFVFYLYDYLWFAYSIALILALAYFIPDFVSFLIDIHQSNLEDIKEQAKQDEEELKVQYVD